MVAIQIYLYWEPESQLLKKRSLVATSAVCQITTRLPHEVVYALAYPALWVAFGVFSLALSGVLACPGVAGSPSGFP